MPVIRVIENINRGGFGKVDKVELDDGRIVARKTFEPVIPGLSSKDYEKLIKRFKREVKVQSHLPEEFFIPIIEAELSSSLPWFVMPLADKNFSEEIEITKSLNKIPEGLSDILNSLEVLHQLGYIHRDLKPQNILFQDGKWKLSDFGLIALESTNFTTELTSTNSAWGTREYCAPEQVSEFKRVTPAVDIFAFGAILHDIFDGRTRIPYSKLTSSGAIGMVIEKCTEKNPKKRFKNINSLRGALLSVIAQRGNFNNNVDTNSWVRDLKNEYTQWSIEKFESFVFYASKLSRNDTTPIFWELDQDRIEFLRNLDEDLWVSLVILYCEWARDGVFIFDYCDVLISRLEKIYDLEDDLNVKVAAIWAAVKLGTSHGRWYVMKKAVEMCNENISDQLAQRVVIEIYAGDVKIKSEFRECIESRWNEDVFHKKIREALE